MAAALAPLLSMVIFPGTAAITLRSASIIASSSYQSRFSLPTPAYCDRTVKKAGFPLTASLVLQWRRSDPGRCLPTWAVDAARVASHNEAISGDPMPNASSPLAQLSTGMAETVAVASRSVVAVHAGRARASRFAWRTGLIVTCEEALPEDEDVEVCLPGGATAPAAVVGRDASTDVALLRIDSAQLPPMALDAAPVHAGAIVLAVGSLEGTPVAAAGAVSLAGPAWRSLRGGDIDARIELDLMLRRSAEGGLALDASARAIGMAVFGPRQRVLVIPA